MIKGGTRCCIFEELLARPTDPCVKDWREIKMLIFDDYHFLPWMKAGKEKIEQGVSQSYGGFPFLGIMTSTDKERLDLYSNKKEPMRKISIEDLEIFAERAEKIFVGGYDFEGFLIWSKN